MAFNKTFMVLMALCVVALGSAFVAPHGESPLELFWASGRVMEVGTCVLCPTTASR